MTTTVITGANRGIGLALAEKYSSLGHRVFALCRNSSPALESLNLTVIKDIDVATEHGLQQMQQALANVSIDILINNAGIFSNETLDDLNSQRIMQQFQVNALAPLLVTERLKAQLSSHAKLAFITSRMGSISDNSSGAYYGYRMSKAALNAAAMSLARDLASSGVSVGIYHPGWVQTEMVNNTGDITATEAAARISQLIEAQNLSNTGSFKHSNGESLPW
ncbi:MAG: short chain dehydrogenase/reductase family oxidoreductase [Osedax symbiont Rs1]|nr:MAG: short chain dehydrogenase/reductase family oxidoreductase [Osedax symbiont Rs1]